MIRNYYYFYLFLIASFFLSIWIKKDVLIWWIIINFVGNSFIIYRSNFKSQKGKRILLTLSISFILLPIIYFLAIVFLLGGITC